jgi:predicted phosphodiesterase
VLGREEMKFLARLPVPCRVNVEDKSFFLVHGTPRDPMDEYLGGDRTAWLSRLEYVESDYVLVGHTHVPFKLELGKTTVLNPGSVGQPRDGDPRAAYAVIDNGNIDFRRVEYDIDAAIGHLKASGVKGEALSVAELALRTGGTG